MSPFAALHLDQLEVFLAGAAVRARHDSGTSSHFVPVRIPSSGRPAASLYMKPQMRHI